MFRFQVQDSGSSVRALWLAKIGDKVGGVDCSLYILGW